MLSSPIRWPSKPVPGMEFEAPGLALIGMTVSDETAFAIGDNGALAGAGLAAPGLDDPPGCGSAPSREEPRPNNDSKPIAHIISATARTCHRGARFIRRSRGILF